MSLPLMVAAVGKAFAAIGTVATSAGAIGAGIQASLAVASTAATFLSQKGAADAQSESNAQANERARTYMIEDYDQVTRMSDQEVAGASQRINANQVDAAKASATAEVAASAGGVSGLSVQSLLGDIYGQEASIRDSVNQNLENTGYQIQNERGNIQRGYTTAINTRPTPQHPSLLGSALEAGTGVLGAYKDHIKVRGKRST